MDIERLERWPRPEDGDLRVQLEVVHKFCQKKFDRSAYKAIEEQGHFPKEIIREIGDLGWLGFTISEEYGGCGKNAVDTAYMMRDVAYWSPSTSLIIAADWLAASTILLGGTEEQKRRILPRQASGEILGCFALTEPDAGSDARAIRTKVERTRHGWKLTGGPKRYITNAGQASFASLSARTGPERNNISLFLLESDEPGLVYPGLSVVEKDKTVFRGSKYAELFYDDGIELPHDALLGELGRSFDDVALKTLDGGRINIAAQAIGLAMWVYDETYAHVDMCKMYGKTLLQLPGVVARFANAKAQLTQRWSQVVAAAEARDQNDYDIRAKAAAVKIQATETAFAVASRLARHYGGALSDPENSMFQRVNNIMMTCEYEGANDALRKIAGKYLHEEI